MILKTTCGTSNYIAPEVLGDRGYDGVPADIWSTGIILFVMVAGYLPFDDRTTSRLFKKIMEDKAITVWTISAALPLPLRTSQGPRTGKFPWRRAAPSRVGVHSGPAEHASAAYCAC